jgi:phage tail-like protein
MKDGMSIEQEPVLAVLHISNPESGEQVVPIRHSPFNIGRIQPNDLVLPNAKVSRAHARLLIEDDRIRLIDLKSSNGTFVSQQRLNPNEPFALSFGLPFEIGPYTLRLDPAPQEAAKPAESIALTGSEGEIAPEQASPARDLPVEPAPVEAPGESLPVDSSPVAVGVVELPPPEIPVLPPSNLDEGDAFTSYNEAIGLPDELSRYLQYLPPMYSDNDFIGKFLLAFEAILSPIEQIVDNFDQYLDPSTSPGYFLDQLAAWLGLTLDEKWPVEKQRKIVKEAAELYRRRGTHWSLGRHLEIYSGIQPEIYEPENQPHHFEVVIRAQPGTQLDRATLERIILANKPAHTTFKLEVVYR